MPKHCWIKTGCLKFDEVMVKIHLYGDPFLAPAPGYRLAIVLVI